MPPEGFENEASKWFVCPSGAFCIWIGDLKSIQDFILFKGGRHANTFAISGGTQDINSLDGRSCSFGCL
jgi:hypothetical protein